MLQLLLGISGTGKSARMMEMLRQRAQAGQYSILIVPEQFTSSTENALYQLLGDRLSGYVSSYSFTSLAEKLLALYGGVAVKTMTPAGRAVLVRRAMEQLGEGVVYYRRHRRSAAFCQLCAETIDELKSAGLTPEKLEELALGAGAGRDKLGELARIFSAYEALMAGSAMDPGDRLLAAAERMEEEFFREKAVFVDEFDTFNAPKKRLLGRILAAAPQVTVALCCDGLHDQDGGLGLFSGAKAVAGGLLRLARQSGVSCAAPIVLEQDLRHQELAPLNRLLAGGPVPLTPMPLPGLTLWEAPSLSEEAKGVAAAIRKLARQGVPYGSMAVICRQSDAYLPALRYEFGLAEIPMFCDEPTTAEHTAPAQAVRAAMGLLRTGLGTVGLMGLVKTGLCALPEDQQCALENYAYTWQLKAADWRAPFTRSPAGFSDREEEGDAAQLALAEEARGFLVPKAQDFLQKVRGASATQVSRQIYFLLKALGAEQVLSDTAAQLRGQGGQGIPAADELIREWNIVMGLLDQMARLLGEEVLPPGEYDDLFCLLLRTSDLGHIPQSLDAVIVTTAGRMRLAGPQYCFVVGLAEGEFPQAPGDAGLLTHADRDALIRQGVELPDCFENRAIREQVCFYKALTVAAKGVWLSWPGGTGGLPCTSALAEVIQAFEPPAPALKTVDYASTPQAALDLMGQLWQQAPAQAAALWKALEQRPEMAPRLKAVRRSADARPFTVEDEETMSQLLGRQMNLSPSRVEQYYQCRFAYFLKYVLKLRPRRKAELSPDVSGSLVHWVLENALKRCGSGFAAMEEDEVRQLACQLTEEYVQLYLPQAGVRFSYLVSRLKKSVQELLLFIQKEQQQGSFRPVALELGIGHGPEDVRPVTLHTPDGHAVQVVGKIDRVDLLEENGTSYLRVLDYKTGTKKFTLEDVYCGLDCQMLLYLFSLERSDDPRFRHSTAAGVLYLLADPAPQAESREEAARARTYTTDGLILDDETVIEAMDSAATGLFVPFSFKKDGTPRASQKLASLDKLCRIRTHVDDLVIQMAQGLYAGQIQAEPLCRGQQSPCQWCDFRSVCGHQDGRGEKAVQCPAKPFEPQQEEENP